MASAIAFANATYIAGSLEHLRHRELACVQVRIAAARIRFDLSEQLFRLFKPLFRNRLHDLARELTAVVGEAAEAVGGAALLLELEEELLALVGRRVVRGQLVEEGVEFFLHLASLRQRADVGDVLSAGRASRRHVGLHVRVQLGRPLGQ